MEVPEWFCPALGGAGIPLGGGVRPVKAMGVASGSPARMVCSIWRLTLAMALSRMSQISKIRFCSSGVLRMKWVTSSIWPSRALIWERSSSP